MARRHKEITPTCKLLAISCSPTTSSTYNKQIMKASLLSKHKLQATIANYCKIYIISYQSKK